MIYIIILIHNLDVYHCKLSWLYLQYLIFSFYYFPFVFLTCQIYKIIIARYRIMFTLIRTHFVNNK